MRALFFVEPAVQRNEPAHLASTLNWAEMLRSSARRVGGDLGVVSNLEICAAWTERPTPEGPRQAFAVDAYAPLRPFGYRLNDYMRSHYGPGSRDNPLYAALSEIRERFAPDIVLMTYQNSIAEAAFEGLPFINLSQAPLLRWGHPDRICFDPTGHQVNSIIGARGEDIRRAHLSDADFAGLAEIVAGIRRHQLKEERMVAAQAELKAIGGGAPIALMAVQPASAVPCRDGLDASDVQSLLCSWADQLPPGWIGVPTFHFALRFGRDLEEALARGCPRLRLLSPDHSWIATEGLIAAADGMVTVNSNSAMAALLFEKPVAMLGQGPLSDWCGEHVADLVRGPRYSGRDILALLAFLTNRYSELVDTVTADPSVFLGIMQAMTSGVGEAHFLDLSSWSLARAKSMFYGLN
ncbi:hypothetical protein [Caulobacter sp. BE254]|uniref:hypothetical protein n=1 Tax=Caulobacter sp. BE254 TaxID=2817720 RepID=UPI00286033D5|nr:hypothetical protein [Caulobacter sp. BE254]MDR7117307.1 hypothetical protein [Caulobacter sp. BE254]